MTGGRKVALKEFTKSLSQDTEKSPYSGREAEIYYAEQQEDFPP